MMRIIYEDGELIPAFGYYEGYEPPTKINEHGYMLVYHPLDHYWISVHKVVDYYYRGPREKNIVIHHVDFNKLNNDISNLKRMDKVEHFKYHSKLRKGKKRNPKIVEKISKIMTGKKATPEAIKSRSKGLKKSWKENPNQGFRGRKHSDESKNKMREAKIGKKPSEETRKKMSESAKKKIFTSEHLKNIKESKKYWVNPMTKPDTRKKLSNTMKEKWKDPEFKKKQSEAIKKGKSKTGWDSNV